jgi:phosphoglycerate kinase
VIDLPKIEDLNLRGKRVIVRADLDFNPKETQNLRFTSLILTLNLIKEKQGNIVLIGHRGRPGGKIDEALSLKPFDEIFSKWGAKVEENLRFDPGEEANDFEYAKKLASLGEVYVNEAFGASHREHASIVGLPKLLPHAAGLRFVLETENLSKVLENPKRPIVILISGIKKDKIDYIGPFSEFADKILIAGRLSEYLQSTDFRLPTTKDLVADLLPDKEDITINSIERFEKEIKSAGTIVLAGPVGKFEEDGHLLGTKRVFEAIAKSSAFKVAGGGDTEKAIEVLGLDKEFDWISVGGGAMLEFLAKGTLPGIEALKA